MKSCPTKSVHKKCIEPCCAVDVMEEVMSEDEEKPQKKGKGRQRKDQGDKRKR